MTEAAERKHNDKLTTVKFQGRIQEVSFVETLNINGGVSCDVYNFVDDDKKDLAIIRVAAGYSTPHQKILDGEKTIEGYISGVGGLMVRRNGEEHFYSEEELRSVRAVNAQVGDEIQWRASEQTGLLIYEICFPPYKDGRYEDLVPEY